MLAELDIESTQRSQKSLISRAPSVSEGSVRRIFAAMDMLSRWSLTPAHGSYCEARHLIEFLTDVHHDISGSKSITDEMRLTLEILEQSSISRG